MSKAVLISINPKWCKLIANGEKTTEVRKTRPKLETPFKCYIYCTKDNTDIVPSKIWWKADKTGFQHILNGKVIGEFVCKSVESFTTDYRMNREQTERISTLSCVGIFDLAEYESGGNSPCLFGWHISDLVIYDSPQPLNWFVTEGDCDCMNCRDCSWFNRGNGYNVEDDCDLGYENVRIKRALKPLFRPPQSWCYIEELEG